MSNLQKKALETYEIEVWFRYSFAGEIEKDCETHEIEALSIQEAIDKAEFLYRNKKAIPYKYFFNNYEYRPTGLTKSDLFHLTAPHYEYP
ncbi:hypothetical protein [Flavobacterium crassostreae]|uniref:Uncharacterized protein n=1 Tax=Flavobacterium crassostreae TaxID=1763534 RepID=A0A1B9E7S0_9FLAO|nr:hypothetical protein [Flavobacterium crassostreae]OCB78000.1 hypothetical protein LPBF_03360 [Flavobacterium crassostreae]